MVIRRVWEAIVVASATGCLTAGPLLSPDVAGCYRVHADEWSTEHANATGFNVLPNIIGLDTVRRGRLLVPHDWRLGSREINWGTLTLELLPWRWSSDSLQFDLAGKPHTMGNDSVIVQLAGWRGRMTTFLERQPDGFEGIGFFSRQPDRGELRGIRVRLKSTSCPSDLYDAARNR